MTSDADCPEEKSCKDCGQTLPVTEFYTLRRGDRVYIRSYCKKCSHARVATFRRNHPGYMVAVQARHYERHREEIKAKALDYYWKNREVARERMRRYQDEHRDEIRRKGREYHEANLEARNAGSRRWRRSNPEKARALDHNAQARLRAAFVEKVDPVEIYLRDGGRCRICGGKVNADLRYPDPRSASMDHIIPISAGGMHEPRNVQLAHLRCNVSRGAGRLPAQTRLLP